jgi:ABC-type nitrate/sulfonate/bicarbonate transport system substrate-binding protein
MTSRTPATFQLASVPDVENAGELVADTKGYFTDEGIDVTLLPGGLTTTVEPLVVSGKCLVGLSATDTTARSVLQGKKLKIIAATLQTTPLAVMSLASKPIATPKDLYGKRLGIQSFQVADFDAFVASVGLEVSKIKLVTSLGDPSILTDGKVDALWVDVTNEPVTLQLQGVATHVWSVSQFGWNMFGDTLEVTDESLADSKVRDTVVHVLRATIHGWQAALADPSSAVATTLSSYGKSLKLDSKQQLASLEAFKGLIETPYTKAHGLLTMSPADIAINLKSIAVEGVVISASKLFDTTVLADAYDGATSIT